MVKSFVKLLKLKSLLIKTENNAILLIEVKFTKYSNIIVFKK